MNPPQEVRIRQGKDNAFKKDWEDGYDPLKPFIEVKDKDGKVIQKRPVSKSYNVRDMKDEELGDFLGEDEKKALKEARRQWKESKGRDLCKEYHEKRKKDEQEKETLQERNQLLEAHARQLEQDFNDYKVTTEARFDKLATMLQSLLPKQKSL
jgi:hypothetical protein